LGLVYVGRGGREFTVHSLQLTVSEEEKRDGNTEVTEDGEEKRTDNAEAQSARRLAE
jgi:hypothetical protein